VKYFVLVMMIALSGSAGARGSHTVLGYSGLLLTPTAYIVDEGELTFGLCRIPKLYADNYKPYDRTVMFADMGFTSFFEASFGFVRPDNFKGGLGDRTATARLRVLKSSHFSPDVAVGIHDFFGVKQLELEPAEAQHFASTYVVASKTLPILRQLHTTFHLGYGFDWLRSNDHHLDGWFGGIVVSPMPSLELIIEHDSHNVNAGVRFLLFSRLEYMFSFWQMRYMMHHLSFSVPLL
jgi:hypothetical protein